MAPPHLQFTVIAELDGMRSSPVAIAVPTDVWLGPYLAVEQQRHQFEELRLKRSLAMAEEELRWRRLSWWKRRPRLARGQAG